MLQIIRFNIYENIAQPLKKTNDISTQSYIHPKSKPLNNSS
jgi:hypothetical protein